MIKSNFLNLIPILIPLIGCAYQLIDIIISFIGFEVIYEVNYLTPTKITLPEVTYLVNYYTLINHGLVNPVNRFITKLLPTPYKGKCIDYVSIGFEDHSHALDSCIIKSDSTKNVIFKRLNWIYIHTIIAILKSIIQDYSIILNQTQAILNYSFSRQKLRI